MTNKQNNQSSKTYK